MNLKLYLTLITILIATQYSLSQCIPGDSISCPDPENNGQICPDSIAPVYQQLDYEQVITFLAPAKIDTLNLSIDIHHLSLIDIEGLPEGIDWETNAVDDEFFPEIYYCILFSGNTTADTGYYPISIVIDVYTLFFGEPVKVATLEDSTSLSIRVLEDPSFVGELKPKLEARIWPNPFDNDFSLEMDAVSGKVEVELLNIMGKSVYKKIYSLSGGISTFNVDASFLPEGVYFVRLRNGDSRRSYMVSKRQ